MQVLIQVFIFHCISCLFQVSFASLHEAPLYLSDNTKILYTVCDNFETFDDNHGNTVKKDQDETYKILGKPWKEYLDTILKEFQDKLDIKLPPLKPLAKESQDTWDEAANNAKEEKLAISEDFSKKLKTAIQRFPRLVREAFGSFKALLKFKNSNDDLYLKPINKQGKIMVFSGFGENGFTSGLMALLLNQEGYSVTVVALPGKDGKRQEDKFLNHLLLKVLRNIWTEYQDNIATAESELKNANAKLLTAENALVGIIKTFDELQASGGGSSYIANCQRAIAVAKDEFDKANQYFKEINNLGKFKLIEIPSNAENSNEIMEKVKDTAKNCTLFLEGHMGIGDESNLRNHYIDLTLTILNDAKKSGKSYIISIDSPMMYDDINGMASLSKSTADGKLTPTNTYVPNAIIFKNVLRSFILAKNMRFKATTKNEHNNNNNTIINYIRITMCGRQMENVDMILVTDDEFNNFMDDNREEIIKQQEVLLKDSKLSSEKIKLLNRVLVKSGRPFYDSTIFTYKDGVQYVQKPLMEGHLPEANALLHQR